MSRMGLLLAGMAVFSLVACTANGDSADASPTYHRGGNASADKSSDSKATSSSSTDSDSSDYSIQDLVEMVSVPAVAYSRGTVEYRVDAFAIGKTEVTQGLYRKVMGAISKDDDLGDDFPVFNVSWYDAALFCNALSKKAGLDTAYVYESVNDGGEYYAQDEGPVAVAGFTPNALGLYDMAGNVAEWVNDWYSAYPTVSQENYTGPVEGKYKGIRGGGWSDKAPALASAERDKKDPKYHSQMVGFRVVYSKGF